MTPTWCLEDVIIVRQTPWWSVVEFLVTVLEHNTLVPLVIDLLERRQQRLHLCLSRARFFSLEGHKECQIVFQGFPSGTSSCPSVGTW